jgi:perosamine synthetase
VSDIIQMAKVELSEQEIEAAVQVLRSGAIRQGKVTGRFEEAFAAKMGARFAVATSSGSSALHVAYLAMFKPGTDVLVPAFTHISTASMVHYAGCRPIFCDVDPETFTIDLEDAERKRTANTKAIVPVHLFGNACDIDAVVAFSEKHGLKIIWDAAQAHRTEYKGRDIGGFDSAVCYSFYPTKTMFTGEGGLLTTNDESLAEACRLLRSHGQTKKYYHPSFGLNYRMTDVEAAIGLAQLGRVDELVAARRANAAKLDAGLAGLPWLITPIVSEGAKHSYHQYTTRIASDSPGARDRLQAFLKERGVMTGVHYPRSVNVQPAFIDAYGETPCPVSERLSAEVLSLPVHPALDSDDLDRIISAVWDASEIVTGG